MTKQAIYLDYNATTPVDPQVTEEMIVYLREEWGNAVSSHCFGDKPKEVIAQARKHLADLIKCSPDEIIFTSGGSESNNLALLGGLKTIAKQKPNAKQVITSKIEHYAISKTLDDMFPTYETIKLDVDSTGMVLIDQLEKYIDPEKTALVSIMFANNEIGTIQPIKQIAEICKKNNVIFHSDAAQAVGKIPIDIADTGLDMMSIAAHKFYGPKGVGALYRVSSFPLEPVIFGAGQESGLRGGTSNVSGIAGLGKAAELARIDFENNHHEHIRQKRDSLQSQLTKEFPDAIVNGHSTERLPNTLSIAFPGVTAFSVMTDLRDSVCFSAGAACSSGKSVSATLNAIKLSNDIALGTIRISIGRFTTEENIEKAVTLLTTAVKKLKQSEK